MSNLRIKGSALGPDGAVEYLLLDEGRWRRSRMPEDVANELLRKLDWTDHGTEWQSATMAIPKSFVDSEGRENRI